MKLDIFDIDEFVKINKCPEVTNPIMLDSTRYPTSDGLFSHELFGVSGSYDRKTIFGYIDLKSPFLHPVAYKLVTSMNRDIIALIAGTSYFEVINGELVESENEKARTGIDFLYEQWDNLVFKTTDSKTRTTKVRLLDSLSKKEAFMTKQIVIPAFYRDIDNMSTSSGPVAYDEVNDMYSKIIGSAKALDVDSGFDFISASTKNRIQNTINDIHTYFISDQTLAKKNGFLRKSLLGKNIDYGTRSVISAPHFNANTWKDQQVPYIYSGVPLGQAMNNFLPFVVYEVTALLTQWFESNDRVFNLKTKEYTYLKDPMADYTPDDIEKIINLFIKSPEERFKVLYVNTEDGKLPMSLFYEDIKRPLTVADILYIATYEAVKDKHIYVTRYPVETHLNIYPTKVKILTTKETTEMRIGHMFFNDYPTIYPDYPVKDGMFYDALVPNNSVLDALGGDYDKTIF